MCVCVGCVSVCVCVWGGVCVGVLRVCLYVLGVCLYVFVYVCVWIYLFINNQHAPLYGNTTCL